MKQVVLDVETTGLDPRLGHRIIEVGCVEIVNRQLGESFQQYFNPEREIDRDALRVHKLTREELSRQPLFAACCDEFLDFIRGVELIIHNSEFDLGFLDAELALMNRGKLLDESGSTVLDTLEFARNRHPGLRNSLDALCERYHVGHADRAEAHGALLDAQLLAQVYLKMTGGQISMSLDAGKAGTVSGEGVAAPPGGFDIPVIPATQEERKAHEEFMARLSQDRRG